jgi:UDP-GlcNAc:undecaprenyl-phosphate GlcNAc-1-phosphate transferase
MTSLIAIFALALAICLALTPCVRFLAIHYGLVDHPDGRRKMHGSAMPVAGGIAILISACLAFTAAFLAPEPASSQLSEQAMPLVGLLIAVLVICGVGVLDDYGMLRGRHKLLGQLVAIGIVIAFGVSVERIQLLQWDIQLGLLALPFTVFLLLGAVNSLNLLDGMDGLLGCVGLIILSAIGCMAVLGSHWPAALVAAALAGALLGFLRYNFPPASIFLGDCGSMLIGLVVGVLAIQSSLKGPATVALAAPLAAMTIPILDTTAAVVRRKLTGRSLYASDRGHLHHCLLNRGLSSRSVLFWVSFFCLFTVIGALGSVALKNELIAFVTAGSVVGILIGIRVFGYSELILARNRLAATANSFLKFRTNDTPYTTQVHLQGSVDWKDIWGRFVEVAGELNLKTVCLDLNAPYIHEAYNARWRAHDEEEPEIPNNWFAEMPLMARGQVVGRLEVTGRRDEVSVSTKIAALSKLVENVEGVVAFRAELQDSDGGSKATTANGNGHAPKSLPSPSPIELESAQAR